MSVDTASSIDGSDAPPMNKSKNSVKQAPIPAEIETLEHTINDLQAMLFAFFADLNPILTPSYETSDKDSGDPSDPSPSASDVVMILRTIRQRIINITDEVSGIRRRIEI